MPKDILLDGIFDLQVAGGDLVVGESTYQHQQLLLLTDKGEWKESPTVSVGAGSFLKDEDVAGMYAEIKEQYEKDGMNFNTILNENGKTKIDAPYNY